MNEPIVISTRSFRTGPALIAAILALAVAACSTTPSSPEAPTRAEPRAPSVPAEPLPTKAAPEPSQEAEPQMAPEPTSSEKAGPETTAAPTVASEEPVSSDPVQESSESLAPVVEPTPRPAPTPEPAPTPAPAAPPSTVPLIGSVTLDVSQVEFVEDDSIRDVVVYFEPDNSAMPVRPQRVEITTQRKRLIPDVLVVPVGSTVSFPNRDGILHNVFSVSPVASFDLGLYGEGESKSHTFDEPGLAVIHCNVHHAMRADVLIVDTPFFSRTDASGNFSIDGIVPTSGELVAWHPRAGFFRRPISLPLAEPVEIELLLVRPRIPDHLDKTGQPYRPDRPSRR